MLRRILVTTIIVLVFFVFGFYLGQQIQNRQTRETNQKLSDLNITNVTGVIEKIEGKTLTVKIVDPFNSPFSTQQTTKKIKVLVTDQTLIQKFDFNKPIQIDEKTGKQLFDKAQFEDLKENIQINIVIDRSFLLDSEKDFIAKEIIINLLPIL